MLSKLRVYLFLIAFGLVSYQSSGIVIDDFKHGPFSGPNATLADSGVFDFFWGSEVVSGLPEGSVLAGKRSSMAWGADPTLTINTIGSGHLVFETAPFSDGGIHLSYGGGQEFNSLLDVDLSANGQKGFEFLFTEAPAVGNLHIAVNATNGQFLSPSVELTGPGVYRFPYSQIINEFGPDAVNPSLATAVFWGISYVPATLTGSTFSIDEIRTFQSIPEPSAFCLVAIVITCVFATKKRINE